jgi:hypothetical protein
MFSFLQSLAALERKKIDFGQTLRELPTVTFSMQKKKKKEEANSRIKTVSNVA